MMLKKLIVIAASLIISILIVVILPSVPNDSIELQDIDNQSLVSQKIIGYSDDNIVNMKVYDSGQLVGIVSDKALFNVRIKSYDVDVDFEYDRGSVGLTENIYCVEELSNLIYENVDNDIFSYLAENKCLGIETNCVEFSTSEGIYERIYVLNEEDFKTAEDQFILNFINPDSLTKINQGEEIASPESFGSVDTGIYIKEKVSITKGVAPLDEILSDVNKVYEFLCYGRNEERQYYTTKVGDTLAGVGYYFNNMSAKQIMMLNPDIIKDENQIIDAGTVLNVTYYSSPLTITVTKQRLAQEVVFPDPVVYVENNSLPIGKLEVDVVEANGLKNVLYSEKWINGVLQEGIEQSSVIVKEAVQGVTFIGAGSVVPTETFGSGNWRWPVANPTITCDFTCYAGHGGVDFYNLYNPWDYVHAIDSGTVIDTGWTDIGGYYARVDHGNGYVTYYGHFSTPAFVSSGQIVSAGEVLGSIGMTGNATGPHVHLAMYYEGSMINPCTVLDCQLLY